VPVVMDFGKTTQEGLIFVAHPV